MIMLALVIVVAIVIAVLIIKKEQTVIRTSCFECKWGKVIYGISNSRSFVCSNEKRGFHKEVLMWISGLEKRPNLMRLTCGMSEK